jgi:tetratricopeptide (TPR) repeat protein
MHIKHAKTVVATMCGLLLTTASALGADARKMSAECVSEQAYKNISECPGGPEKFEGKKRKGTSFGTKPPPIEPKKRTDSKPGDVGALEKLIERDTRKGKMQQRVKSLLITEITGLERLYKSTPAKSPDKPQLTLRLAEAYAELEQSAIREKIAADIAIQDAKQKKQDTTALRKEVAKSKQMEKAARSKAIAYYKAMAKNYSNYSKLDEVLYYLAYEYEQAGDLQNARKTYYELIEKAPKSPYVPNAYLAFGELFFQEASADPSKWDFAEAAYKEVIKYPPPNNKLYGYAHYKLGYVYWNQGKYKQALEEFKKVIEFGNTYTQLPNAKQLATSARRDLIPVYAASEAPNKAFVYFKPLAEGKTDENAIAMMRDLGYAYIDTGHYPEGIELYKDLMARDKGEHWCTYQSQITTAVQAAYSSDKEKIKRELDQQVEIRKQFGSMKVPDKAKFECDNKTAELLSETAMSWHLEAVGTGGVRGTNNPQTMDLAAYVYKKVADNFTAQDFEKFEFPRIVKEDWPTIYKVKYAMADLLYFQQRWELCGPAFDAVVAENPKGPDAAEAAYASVLCYQKMYDQMYKGDADRKGKGLGPKGASEEDRQGKKGEWEKFKPKQMSEMQKGMVTAFNRYVCYITPAKGDAEAEEQFVEVKYARARTYFEAQHWEEAALGFRDIAINHADKDAGIFAAQLYLEAVNVLGSKAEPPRPACFDDMAADVPVFLKNYCQGKAAEDNKEQCELLTRIEFDVKRLAAQKKVELADSQSDKGDLKSALENYKAGGDAYLDLWRGYCEKPLSEGQKVKQCETAHEIVYNMAKAYQAGRLLAKSIQARMILLNPKFGMHNTDLAQKAIYEIGGNYQAIAVYDKAAEFYERYAKDTKFRGENADQALSDAVVLRLGLGQEDKALDNANLFQRNYGARKPAQSAQIGFAIAAHYGDKGAWDDARKSLTSSMRLIDSSATLDVRLQAHALLGRALHNLKSKPAADREYRTVVGLWSDPKKATAAIEKDGGPRELGRALEAVGEALFYFAEQKKEKVDAYKFPEYKGPKDKEGINKHISTKVKDWYTKKRDMIAEVSKEYEKVVLLEPVPPPRWVISAGSRVGEMWGTFVADFRSAPIPKEWEKDYEIRTAYYGALDEASEPFKRQARGAYEVCLGYSVKHQYFDKFSRSCEEWLAENYKSEFHLVDEFRGAPTRVNDPLKEQAYPLRLGGEPMVSAPTVAPDEKKQEAASK